MQWHLSLDLVAVVKNMDARFRWMLERDDDYSRWLDDDYDYHNNHNINHMLSLANDGGANDNHYNDHNHNPEPMQVPIPNKLRHRDRRLHDDLLRFARQSAA